MIGNYVLNCDHGFKSFWFEFHHNDLFKIFEFLSDSEQWSDYADGAEKVELLELGSDGEYKPVMIYIDGVWRACHE